MQFNPNYNQITQIPLACRALKYLVGTFIPPGYRATTITATTNPIGTSLYFLHGTTAAALPTLSFTFAVDEVNLLEAPASHLVGLEYMKLVFPNGATAYNILNAQGQVSNNDIRLAAYIKGCFACGVPINESAKNNQNMRVIKFQTICSDTSATINIPNLSMFIACHTSSLVYDPSPNKYRLLM